MSRGGRPILDLSDADPRAFMARPDLSQELLTPWLAMPPPDLPFRAHRDESGAALTLHRDARFDLSILSLPGRLSLPKKVVATGRTTLLCLLAGDATLARWIAGPVTNDFVASAAPPLGPREEKSLQAGTVAEIDGRCEAWRILTGDDDAVVLKLVVMADQSPLLREYDVADGRLCTIAPLDEAASRESMLLSALRHLGRTDAAPLFEAGSEHPAFFVRWRAMREWLALDAHAALPRLTQMAATDPHPEVREAAGTTQRMLDAPCPA